VFGNLEAPLASCGNPREKLITFRSDPVLAGDLASIGFNVISLANNHSMDYGGEALLQTIALLEEQGVRCVGAGADLNAAIQPVTLVSGGTKVGFAAWSCLLPAGSAAGPDRAGHAPLHVRTAYEINPYYDMEEPGNPPIVRTHVDPDELAGVKAVLRQLCEETDFVVASIHWGYGRGDRLAEYQTTLGKALIDAGADIVIGHHVHALQGVETYNKRAILYSLGGFIAQQPRVGQPPEILALYDEMSPETFTAIIELSTGGYELRVVPMATSEDGLPVILDGSSLEIACDYLQTLSGPLGTSFDRDENGLTARFGE
jgi:poly-gamma-glutamate synthesis protein (capsule biosynthesis protein)